MALRQRNDGHCSPCHIEEFNAIAILMPGQDVPLDNGANIVRDLPFLRDIRSQNDIGKGFKRHNYLGSEHSWQFDLPIG